MKWNVVGLMVFLAASAAQIAPAADPLELKKGDHICIVGNTLAERMQHSGWLETLLHARFPQHELVFRNLGYSGDEIDGYRDANKRLRSMSFGSHDEWLSANAPVPQPQKLNPNAPVSANRFALTNTKADVIFAFYGYNESFAGEAGLSTFKQDVAAFIKHTASQKYNGNSAPKLVLFSPIAHEYINDPNLQSKDAVAAANARLKLYSEAIAEVAVANNVLFVDLFNATVKHFNAPEKKLNNTINGIHLNETGDMWVAANSMDFLPKGTANDQEAEWWTKHQKLRTAVNEKNWFWYQRYRATDGYSTFGDRAFLKFVDGQSNYEVVQRELEALDVMTSNRDPLVWAAAQGKEHKVEDNNLPAFIPVITNKPGPLPGGKHLFLGGKEAIEKMTVHKGMKVELFASEEQFPELINPVQMSFDTKGRLWVATWPTYPHWKPTEKMNDALLILEDTNGDGQCDVVKSFCSDLHNPTGFEFWNGGVIVAQGPDLLFLKDTNGDDKYDVKERIIHGLDTADTHHTSNSFVLDPGGALYFQEGTFHHSQVESPWGPARRVANGAVFRYEPRAQKLDVYVSFGFANPHGHAFDHWGQDFVYDGTGSNPYHGALFSGDVEYPNKHGRPPQVYQQRTRPCPGVEFLGSSHFPEELRGNLLVGNVIGFQGILQYKMSDKSASFGATEVEPIISSTDPNFRPADLETAPDGSLYFTDWQNPIIGHMQHNLRDPSRDRIHGRVYRVRAEGRDLLNPTPIAGEPIAKLLDLLKEKDDRVRYRVRIELSGRDSAEVTKAAAAWVAALDTKDPAYEHHALEALWLHQSHNTVNEPLLKKTLRSPDFHARAAATRVLCGWRDRVADVLELLRAQVNDEHPRVRLEAVRTLSFFTGEQAEKALEVAVESLIHPQDEYLKVQLDETNKTLDRRVKALPKK
jgi:glucose/arabinose dehydrogenase